MVADFCFSKNLTYIELKKKNMIVYVIVYVINKLNWCCLDIRLKSAVLVQGRIGLRLQIEGQYDWLKVNSAN